MDGVGDGGKCEVIGRRKENQGFCLGKGKKERKKKKEKRKRRKEKGLEPSFYRLKG